LHLTFYSRAVRTSAASDLARFCAQTVEMRDREAALLAAFTSENGPNGVPEDRGSAVSPETRQ
jgi:hypothetical protein